MAYSKENEDSCLKSDQSILCLLECCCESSFCPEIEWSRENELERTYRKGCKKLKNETYAVKEYAASDLEKVDDKSDHYVIKIGYLLVFHGRFPTRTWGRRIWCCRYETYIVIAVVFPYSIIHTNKVRLIRKLICGHKWSIICPHRNFYRLLFHDLFLNKLLHSGTQGLPLKLIQHDERTLFARIEYKGDVTS